MKCVNIALRECVRIYVLATDLVFALMVTEGHKNPQISSAS